MNRKPIIQQPREPVDPAGSSPWQVDFNFRWNDAFYPWKTIPAEFEIHQTLRQPDNLAIKKEDEVKCTVVCMIYSRWHKLPSYVAQFREWGEIVGAIVIVCLQQTAFFI